MLQGGQPQAEGAVAVELSGKQALVGRGEADLACQPDLGNFLQIAAIVHGVVQQYAALLVHRLHGQYLAIEGFDVLPHLERNAGQGGAVYRIGALLVRRRKPQGYRAAGHFRDNTQAQGRIRMADPTLANGKSRCFQESSDQSDGLCPMVGTVKVNAVPRRSDQAP